MAIAVACDHGGFPLKKIIIGAVQEAGYDVIDLGTDGEVSVDYPDFAVKIGQCILNGQAEKGILICGSGVGASIAANKMKGIYAAICHDTYSAHQGVEHDNMNVLCLGARIIGPELAIELVKAYLSAVFSNSGRYLRRFEKVKKIEQN
jgi:ribose 5-phosphate isomerase B